MTPSRLFPVLLLSSVAAGALSGCTPACKVPEPSGTGWHTAHLASDCLPVVLSAPVSRHFAENTPALLCATDATPGLYAEASVSPLFIPSGHED